MFLLYFLTKAYKIQIFKLSRDNKKKSFISILTIQQAAVTIIEGGCVPVGVDYSRKGW